VVPVHRLLHGVQQLLAPLAITAVGAVVVAQGDAGPAGQTLDCFHERQVLEVTHEADHVSAGTTAEAVVHAELGVDGERRALLGVERAEALPLTADLLEADVLARQPDEVGRGPHPRHVLVDDAHAVEGTSPVRARWLGYRPRSAGQTPLNVANW
jgi:hypothetical protein